MSATHADLREIHNPGPRTREWMVHQRNCPALTAFGIRYLGRSEAHEDFHFLRLAPAYDLVLGSLSGQGEMLVGGQWVPIAPSTAALFKAGAPHRYRWQGPGPWNLWWVAGRMPAVARAVTQGPLTMFVESELIDACVLCFAREHAADAASALAPHYAALIHGYLARALGRNRPAPRLTALWQMVEADLARPWSNADLAAATGLSIETLRRLCQRESGRAPMAQVTHLRMGRASLLLARSPHTIESIAADVGYGDPFAFSVAFKRQFGVPPSAYRRALED
jgi:AraC-like DNA-binding protein